MFPAGRISYSSLYLTLFLPWTSKGTEGFSVGIKSDGTLVATGQYYYGSDISGLLAITNVKQIARERENVVLLKNDGA